MTPVSDTFAGPSTIDLTYLESSSLGQRDFVLRAIDISIEKLREHVEELRSALELRDWSTLRFSAHKLKSAVGLLGMGHLEGDLRRLEAAPVHSDQIPSIAEAVQAIRAACTLAVEELCVARVRFL